MEIKSKFTTRFPQLVTSKIENGNMATFPKYRSWTLPSC